MKNTLEICEQLGVSNNLTEIEATPKEIWKNQIKVAINKSEEEALSEWAASSRKYKSTNLNIHKKAYISYLPPALAMTILKARVGMTEVKVNYKSLFTTNKCRICKVEEETLEHLLMCNQQGTENDKLFSEASIVIKNVEHEGKDAVVLLAKHIHRVMEEIRSLRFKDDQVMSIEDNHGAHPTSGICGGFTPTVEGNSNQQPVLVPTLESSISMECSFNEEDIL